jgi:hypothetical protein
MESNREPLSVSEGLELVNGLIKDKLYQSEWIKWKHTYLVNGKVNMDPAGSGRLAPNYWRNFLNRHPILHEKKHVKFDHKEDDFVKPELFHGMYNQIYTKQVHTCISVMHDQASSYDQQGNFVDDDDPTAFGMPTRFQCLHPEKVIMVDDTGDDTNQGKNGQRGGKKFLTT